MNKNPELNRTTVVEREWQERKETIREQREDAYEQGVNDVMEVSDIYDYEPAYTQPWRKRKRITWVKQINN